ncbi:protein-disulfide reductase DsbD N-terminal domain-containing protein [Burkholderiales bacterium]|nr:protein-disulfide reductase DsbD N-terminal domain-containing protein [Burkholderiales bacterium]
MKRFLMILMLCWAAQAAADKPDNLNKGNFYRLSGNLISENKLVLTYYINECCYIYKRSLTFELLEPQAVISGVAFPSALKHKDEFFGEVEVYRGQVNLVLDLDLSQGEQQLNSLSLKAVHQGCSDEGICFLPEENTLNFSFFPGLN